MLLDRILCFCSKLCCNNVIGRAQNDNCGASTQSKLVIPSACMPLHFVFHSTRSSSNFSNRLATPLRPGAAIQKHFVGRVRRLLCCDTYIQQFARRVAIDIISMIRALARRASTHEYQIGRILFEQCFSLISPPLIAFIISPTPALKEFLNSIKNCVGRSQIHKKIISS